MHSRLKLIIPLGLLFCFGCIDVPPVDAPPETTPQPQPDGGTNPHPPEQAAFTLSVAPTRLSALQGRSEKLQLSLTREGGFSGSVSVSAVNPPVGITVLPVTIPAGGTSVNLDVSVGESATPGAQVLTLKGTAGTLSHETAFELTVVKLGDLLVSWASPAADTEYVNGSLALQVSVEGGTADYVEVLREQTVLQRLSGPSYQYTWDTTQTPEQRYTLTARAVRGTATFTTSTAKTVVVDRTAPTVVSRTPGPGASNVSVREAMQVGFSEALKPTTVKDASVLVSAGGTSIAKTLSLAADAKSLTVTPNAPLPVQSNVTVTLGTATEPLTDLAGNAVVATNAWTFSVPAWLPVGGAISALAGSTPAENVALKVGSDGVPVVAWSEFDGSTNAKYIYVRRWDGAQWGAVGDALNAVTGTGTDADRPALVLDGENRPIVVWDESSDSTNNLYGRRWSGSSWEALPAIPSVDPEDLGRHSPMLAMDGLGNITVAAKYDSFNGPRQSVFSLTVGQSSWANVTPPRPSGVFRVESPSVGINSSRDAFVVSTFMLDGGERGVFVQKHQADTGWSVMGEMVFSASGKVPQTTAVTMDGAGSPLFAWSEAAFQNNNVVEENVHAARWNGSSWEVLGGLVSSGSTLSSRPSVLVGSDGQPLVAWSGVSSSERSIWVSRWNGSSWQQVGSPFSAVAGATAAFRPVVELDRKNERVLLAWHESDGTASNIYVYRYNN